MPPYLLAGDALAGNGRKIKATGIEFHPPTIGVRDYIFLSVRLPSDTSAWRKNS